MDISLWDVMRRKWKISMQLDIAPSYLCSVFRGEYAEEKTLQLYVKNDKASVYYTLDGTEPTSESTLYTEGIVLEAGTTVVKAISVNEKGIPSQVISREYVIEFEPPAPPQISPSSGKFTTDMDTEDLYYRSRGL